MYKSKLLEAIKARRTIRRYTKQKPPAWKIHRILEAGQWSQSVHNQQPWEFIVIKNRKVINKIGNYLLKFSRNALVGFNIVLRETAQNICCAPILIMVYNTRGFSKRAKRLGKPYVRLLELFEIQSIAASIQNICLVADDLSLGSAWLGGPLFCETQINRLLKEERSLMAVITVGCFNKKFAKKTCRKAFRDIVRVI